MGEIDKFILTMEQEPLTGNNEMLCININSCAFAKEFR